MTKEIIINHTSHETRVAVMDGGLLTEVHHEREKVMRVVDNIYKGKVLNVLRGMESAFIAAENSGLPIWAGFSAREGADGKILSFAPDREIDFHEIVKILRKYAFNQLLLLEDLDQMHMEHLFIMIICMVMA